LGDAVRGNLFAGAVQAVFDVVLALAAGPATSIIATHLSCAIRVTRGVFTVATYAVLAFLTGSALAFAAVISAHFPCAAGLTGTVLAEAFHTNESRITKSTHAAASIISALFSVAIQGANGFCTLSPFFLGTAIFLGTTTSSLIGGVFGGSFGILKVPWRHLHIIRCLFPGKGKLLRLGIFGEFRCSGKWIVGFCVDLVGDFFRGSTVATPQRKDQREQSHPYPA